ncbi:hypothetical protein VNO78_11308 [Psophocarpus tetragonolobus]|uniref:Uncharacterized protein n=1 Tax=Psophocarpus tetragonolobus TaxID=3891 RepID=A0AAN9STB4_PSOTE
MTSLAVAPTRGAAMEKSAFDTGFWNNLIQTYTVNLKNMELIWKPYIGMAFATIWDLIFSLLTEIIN